MPRQIWMHEVYVAAKASIDDGERYCGRARLNRWYDDEMTVWMAADSLASFVKLGKREEAAEHRAGELGRVLRDSIKRSRPTRR